jgi:hypothetical protein
MEWRKKNPEKQKALAKASNAKRWARVKDDPVVKAKAVAKTRAWYKDNRERALLQKRLDNAKPEVKARRLNNALQNMYGITAAQRDALFDLQGRKCAICEASDSRRWEVDHCHSSGAVRGILCSGCNLMLGHGRDDTQIMTSAIRYLKAGGFENVARIIKR